MKKFFKIFGIIVLVLILLLVSIPFLFKNTIKEKIMEKVNESVNAQISFTDFSLSVFKNFPNATVELEGLKVINNAPFAGDTLAYVGNFSAKVNLKDILFKGDKDPYKLLGFSLSDAVVNVHMNEEGKGNFDIAKSTSDTTDEEPNNFSLDLKEYSIENLRFTFRDDTSKMSVILDSLYHKGKGNFANQVLDLETTTATKVSFASDGTAFLRNNVVTLDAVLGIDLNQQKYTLKDNTLKLNALELNFDGFVQLLEDGQLYNLSFKTPKTTFKNFLDLIPAAYTKSIEGVQTTGEFTINGKVDGKYTPTTIPKLDIRMLSNNASFKYPSLPKSVKNIDIDVKIGNETEKLEDTYVNINRFAFTIDQDAFSVKALLRNLTKNMLVNADLKGVINLENIQKAYPVKMDLDLKGILKADISTAFDMASVEKKAYERIQNSGHASLEKFVYSGAGFLQPFHINKAGISFNNAKIELTELDAKTGKTDFNIKGTLENFYGFTLRDEVLKGNFTLASNHIDVGDFMQTDTPAETPKQDKQEEKPTETKPTSKTNASIKIPAFLDCSLDAKAKSVLYDKLNLTNVSGKLIIKDEKVSLQNLQTDIFGGKTAVTGSVSTKGDTSTFSVDLDMNKLNVMESFSQIEMLKKIMPIAKVVEGFFSSKINVKGKLTPELTPDINSISGSLSAALLDSHVKEASPLVSALDAQFNQLNLSKLNLKDLKANVTFENGRVVVKPFAIKWNGSTINVAGTHGFDQTMDYKLTFNVPAKMLGQDASALLAKLTVTEQQKLGDIPVNVNMGGNFTKPQVSTDMKQVVNNLALQVAKAQANQLTDKVMDKVGKEVTNKITEKVGGEAVNKATDALGKLIGGKTSATDTTKTTPKEQTKKAVNNLLDGLFKKKNNNEQ
ncbi:AsmA-like C-terminal region-containing protein [Capnocytophaga gingivalis]|uniref:AsmA-like C-terminal region-containing protein n=1 Tax=Capnocytophaga gingivalis TaxID=1017 RepID=UPI0028D8456F|nr:AsmA-like C-terminal region-containing protein [Capnocytophaga gingivalis]